MTSKVSAETVLQRQPNLKFRTQPDSSLEIKLEQKWVPVAHSNGLGILEVFSQPRKFSEGLKLLQSRVVGRQDWMELTTAIKRMIGLGILCPPRRTQKARSQRGFDRSDIHTAMLNDQARTSGYLEAISQTVKPGDVVVDLGTGTGVLAVAAALAGAKKVYAIEAGQIGATAQKVFAANGVEDRITLVPGWSTKVELPEKADVLVSEILGNSPFGEKVLEYTLDARRRFLKPGARMIPFGLKIQAALVSLPSRLRDIPCKKNVKKWQTEYGIDFSPLLELPQRLQRRTISSQNCADVQFPENLSELAEIDFRSHESFTLEAPAKVTAPAQSPGQGVIVSFVAQLTEELNITTYPELAGPTCHWASQLWLLPGPSCTPPGGSLEILYSYANSGAQLRLL